MSKIKRRTIELRPIGADGSAACTKRVAFSTPHIIRAIRVDYQNQPSTVDLTIYENNASGLQLFQNTSSNTDIAQTPVGTAGVDETGAATAATDGVAGGLAFTNALWFDVAQGDGQTSGNERILVTLYLQECSHVQATIRPVGNDGSAVGTYLVRRKRAGYISHMSIDYQNQPGTTDILIKEDDSSGATLFTRTSSATDIARSAVGSVGIDEAGGASAATDGMAGGFHFDKGFYIDVAQGDGQTSGNEKIVFDFWIVD